MNGLFLILLSLSFSGTLVILVLLLLRPLFRDRISKQWQYYIWLLAVARLLLPFTPQISPAGVVFQGVEKRMEQVLASNWADGRGVDIGGPAAGSNANAPDSVLPAGSNTKAPDSVLPAGSNADAPDSVLPAGSNAKAPDSVLPAGNNANAPDSTFPVNSGTSKQHFIFPAAVPALLQNLWLVWLFTAAVLFIRKITIYQSFVRYTRAGCSELSDIRRLDLLAEAGASLGIRTPVEVCTNSLLSSPLLLGFFRPRIILPTADIPDSDYRYTMLHELMHFKRKDMFYKWLVQFTICLHWFNPLVWLMGREINRACELSCDEAVIRSLNTGEQREYGNTLLNAARYGGSYRSSLASVTLNESKELLKERLGAIMNYKKPSPAAVVTVLLLTLLLGTGTVITGAYAAAPPEPAKTAQPQPEQPLQAMGKSHSNKSYLYTQNGYYIAPYIFEMGWNLNQEGYDAYPLKTDIRLSDGTVLSVSFDNSCRSHIGTPEMTAALTQLLETVQTEHKDSSLPIERPLIVSIEYVGDQDIHKLAEEYYTTDQLVPFTAIFVALDQDVKLQYYDRIMDDSKVAFFAANLKNIDSSAISRYAEKAYETNSIAFFSILVPHLSREEKQSFAARASRDRKQTFSTILLAN